MQNKKREREKERKKGVITAHADSNFPKTFSKCMHKPLKLEV